MSTKQCDCCDLVRDNYEVNSIGNPSSPGALFLICDDCEDSCPLDQGGSHICNISGRAMKPDVEKALMHNGVGNHPASLGAAPIPPSPMQGMPPAMQQIIQQAGWNLMGGPPAAPVECSHCQHVKAARGCACSHCDCGCTSCAGSGQQDAGTNGATALSACPDCEGTGASRKPKPPPKHLTKTQTVAFDSELERMKLQLKAGLNNEGRLLTEKERKDLERQVQIREPNEEDEARELLESELGTYDAEMRALLGMKD